MRETSIINRGITLWLVALAVAGCGGSTTSVSPSPHSVSSAPAHTTPTAPAEQTTTAPTTPAHRPAPTRASGSLAGRTIVIDPGHNGGNANAPSVINQLVPAGRGRTKPCNTTGTATDGGYPEANFNWDLALRLKMLLAEQGARVVMTRHSNTGIGPCVDRRAAIGNAAHADAVIAIHADGAPASGRGFHVIYAPDSGSTASTYQASLELARAVHDAILASGLLPTSTYAGQNGYNERDDLAGLNLSTRPTILVELGNMRNSTDAALQIDPGFRQFLAAALAHGLEISLGAHL
jgi:N-acetylmuramoyl-L-alanine amidase